MSRVLSTYETVDRGKAVISISKEVLNIDYYDDHGRHFFNEEYPNKSMRYVTDAAENWVSGIKKLEDAI